jgi:hypothetical protein
MVDQTRKVCQCSVKVDQKAIRCEHANVCCMGVSQEVRLGCTYPGTAHQGAGHEGVRAMVERNVPEFTDTVDTALHQLLDMQWVNNGLVLSLAA